ncbi:hypothetical protein [Anaeromyxobacter diazotrophicus]|uniref:Uncharacterized protein n=1 Tax=Anaeromyxobacter diazotrophicus TaxID=2590199 RepID=A0A7I9VP32_9BACT|nr:hypothetical protein [Anaeromyxobacter diazotrophicus]GEJ57870.1 hypothetical protein AMYX_26110 [Anaeromyxobacter diazotrophicus]
MSSRSPAFLALLAALGAAPRPGAAAVAVPASIEELARASSAVVRGRVASAAARWSADHRRIETEVEVEVASAWRGAAASRVAVVVPGGEVDGLGQRVDGAPRLAPGEEVVLFLWGGGARPYRVTGLAQGKFAVKGPAARPDLSGLSFVPRAALRAGERRVEELALDELERRVRAVP